MKEYILAIDQSTSGTKAIVFNNKGKLINRKTVEHKQYYPQTGWVEHDPVEIYQNTLKAINLVLEECNLEQSDLAALGITNQRETVVVWDKNTGEPVYNAAVWQCQRGNKICAELKEKGYGQLVKAKTGLIIDPYFSASKIKWILDNVEDARNKAEAGELLFGTIDSWLVWNLTEGEVHATDYSNACRTMLFNIHELKWDQELFDLLEIPLSLAPEVKYSDEIFGYTAQSEDFQNKIPVTGVLGDSHAALFGQSCYQEGMAKTTYGTGSSIMMNIGNRVIESQSGLVTSIGWAYDGNIDYVFEGNVHCTGATIKWLVDDLELIQDSRITDELANSVDGNNGVYFIPAFVGLGAPYWDNDVTATITGMTRGTKKAHVVRAALEAIAYQIKDVLDLMRDESGIELTELRVDGGPTNNRFLMQFQADMLGIKVAKSALEEVSALGSAYMAGLAVGLWSDLEEIKSLRKSSLSYSPEMVAKEREYLYQGWKKVVARTIWREEK